MLNMISNTSEISFYVILRFSMGGVVRWLLPDLPQKYIQDQISALIPSIARPDLVCYHSSQCSAICHVLLFCVPSILFFQIQGLLLFHLLRQCEINIVCPQFQTFYADRASAISFAIVLD